jgi:hypothetical protein
MASALTILNDTLVHRDRSHTTVYVCKNAQTDFLRCWVNVLLAILIVKLARPPQITVFLAEVETFSLKSSMTCLKISAFTNAQMAQLKRQTTIAPVNLAQSIAPRVLVPPKSARVAL